MKLSMPAANAGRTAPDKVRIAVEEYFRGGTLPAPASVLMSAHNWNWCSFLVREEQPYLRFCGDDLVIALCGRWVKLVCDPSAVDDDAFEVV
jgi:hypothetical protein